MPAMTSPTPSHSPSPSNARGIWRPDLLRLPLRQQLSLLRMACAATLGPSVSEAGSTALALPFATQRLVRLILLGRGMWDSNPLGSRAMARCARRLFFHLERTAVPCAAQPLPVFDLAGADPDEFYAAYVQPQRPVLLRGFTKRARWSVDWLLENFGEREVKLSSTGGINFDARVADLESPAPDGGPLYLHNYNEPFRQDPKLADELGVQALGALVRRERPMVQALFASVHAGTRTPLHCAGNLNTFLLLEGRKRWCFIDPSFLVLLYPYLSHTNSFQTTLITDELDHDAHDRWPLFRFCPRYTVDLEAGDVLLSPTWWYHSIENLTARTLAVAVRWKPYLHGEVTTNRLFRLLDTVANRSTPEANGPHQDTSEQIHSAAARACWGLPPV